MKNKEKIKVLYPGDSLPLDTTIKTKFFGSALLVGLLTFFLATSIATLISLKLYPVALTKTPLMMVLDYWNMLLGMASTPLVGSGFIHYAFLFKQAVKSDSANLMAALLFAPAVLGAAAGVFMFFVFFKPVGGVKTIRGKEKLYDKEAYANLKKEFDFLNGKDGSKGSKIVLASEDGKFNPNTTSIDSLKRGAFIEIPEEVRTKHSMVSGGTGRGKTQFIKYTQVSQIYNRILAGENVKAFLLDTPKGDYSSLFAEDKMFKLAPEEEGSISWDISKDLYNNLTAEAFWQGKIPANDKDPIWSNAAIAVGTGATVFLQVVAPEAWNYGMLAYLLGKSGDELEPILKTHYPEANQFLNSAEETLSSVMFNIGTYTKDFIQLGRIFDGYHTKAAIYQATAKALKHPQEGYLDFITTEMEKDVDAEGDTNDESKVKAHQTTKEQAKFKAVMFKGLVRTLNKADSRWRWKNFAHLVNFPLEKQISLVLSKAGLSKEEAEEIRGKTTDSIVANAWVRLCENVAFYAEQWDEFESQKRLSIKEWFKANNPERQILVLKPSEKFPTLTDSLIRGILTYSDSVVLGELEDSKTRKLHIIIDEFQSYGNIKTYTTKALALYRSRGCSVTLAFQDVAQLEDLYGDKWVNFLTSNMGSIFLLGTNEGTTNQRYSDLVGEATIKRLHRSVSYGANGKSISEDWQEHQVKVMTPDEFNLLGANTGSMTINYCYIVGGLNPVYLLEAPILSYPTRSRAKEAKWVKEVHTIPQLPDLRKKWKGAEDKTIA